MSWPLLSLSPMSRQAVRQRSQASAHAKQVSVWLGLEGIVSIVVAGFRVDFTT